MRQRAFFLLTFWAAFIPLRTPAQQSSRIGWHPNVVTDVGRGLDWHNQAVIKPVVVAMPAAIPPYNGTGSADLSASFAQHQFDLVNAFSMNMSASLESLAGNGNVGFSFVDNQNFTQNTLTFAFTATRNFGTTLLEPVSLAPDFVAYVNLKKQTLSGPALHNAIVQKYGTHFITGYSSAASIDVIYSFNFGSAYEAQSFGASISASYGGFLGSADFQSTVQRAFQQTDTSTTINYRIHTSDPINSFPVTSGTISSLADYTNLLNQLTTFANQMSPTNAQRAGWVTQPIEDAPGYLSLVGYDSVGQFDTSYERFMQIYSQLKNWDKLLLSWTVDTRHMSWMNAAGQAQVQAVRADADSYLASLNQIALSYFSTGSTLEVPNNVLNYLSNLNNLPIPTIYVLAGATMQVTVSNPNNVPTMVIGYIYFGSKSQTTDTPVGNVVMVNDGLDNYLVPLTFDPDLFEQQTIAAVAPGDNTVGLRQWVTGTFSTPLWASLKAQSQTNRLAFFFEGAPNPSHWTWVIRDNAGSTIDQLSLQSFRSSGVLGPAVSGGMTSVSANIISYPTNGTAGLGTAFVFSVTNAAQAPVYGTQIRLPLDTNRFEFLSATTSQGSVSYSNGIVAFNAGSLAPLGSATVNIMLVPLSLGQIVPAGTTSVLLGPGLTNATSGGITLDPVSIISPTLNVAKVGSLVELQWQSATDRMKVETSAALGAGANWQPAQITSTSNGISFSAQMQATEQHRFYRLNIR
ncbi:MAG: hypothetical protein NT154_15430 [Verrucomicrobia bacterium]|nr:hypothetical protein [Verrucomicrobiota bacterium]